MPDFLLVFLNRLPLPTTSCHHLHSRRIVGLLLILLRHALTYPPSIFTLASHLFFFILSELLPSRCNFQFHSLLPHFLFIVHSFPLCLNFFNFLFTPFYSYSFYFSLFLCGPSSGVPRTHTFPSPRVYKPSKHALVFSPVCVQRTCASIVPIKHLR